MAFMGSLNAAVHIINAEDTMFNPDYISDVHVGDTIRWVRVNGVHSTTSTTIPAGASPWGSPLNSTVTTFDYIPIIAGTYHYQCVPHDSLGITGSFRVIGPTANPCDALNCADSDACTTDACDSISGCVYTAVVCNDSDLCTTDACVTGICEFETIVDCGVGMRDIPNSINLNFFPNPASNFLTVMAMDPLRQISITDFKGKQVYVSRKLNSLEHSIQTSLFASGIYFLHVRSDRDATIKKFIIER